MIQGANNNLVSTTKLANVLLAVNYNSFVLKFRNLIKYELFTEQQRQSFWKVTTDHIWALRWSNWIYVV